MVERGRSRERERRCREETVDERGRGKSRAESGGQEERETGVERGGEASGISDSDVWGGSVRSEEARGAGPAERLKRRRCRGWERPFHARRRRTPNGARICRLWDGRSGSELTRVRGRVGNGREERVSHM
jgi:hypothetical protein